MPSINIGADATQGVNEVAKFNAALGAIVDRIDKLNSVTTEYNKRGQFIGATVKSQTGAFETLTQVVNKSGVVIQSYYTKNEEGARKADAAAAKKAEADKKRADDEAARLAKQGTILDNILGRIGRIAFSSAISRFTGFIANEIQDGIKAAKDFQIQLSLIRTIQQGADQQSFRKTGADVRSVSDTTGFDIKDVGKAFYDATSNQITKGNQTKEFVRQAADFARVTGSDLPAAVNLLSTAINSYGLSAADAEKISAIFFKTIDEGRVVASEMANTLGRLYPLADQVGVSMTEVNSVIAITTQKGVKTNDAITLMSNLLVKLEKPTEQTAEFFKSLGVNSGEAAIQLYGFTGLLKKMVEAVNSGQVPVSAFFDEIRGRKQFAVFQQSIDDIDKFNNKLKDTNTVLTEYRTAQTIRGESAGDQLAKELNKLQNVFKVELGQAILENLNSVNKWAGGIDGVRNSAGDLTTALIAGGIVISGYTTVQLIAARANITFAATARAAGASMLAALPAAIALASAYVVYKASKDKLFGGGENLSFAPDPAALDAATSALERYIAATAKVKPIENPFESLDKQKEKIDGSFRSVLGLIASANIVNNKFLDEAKEKSKDVAASLKVSLAGFTDVLKQKITDIKKGITDANEELKRSKKSAEKFGDTAAEALFNFRSKYANDDLGEQKIRLTQSKVIDLQKKANEEYAKGTEESIAEGRRLYEILISEEVKLEELKVDHRKKQYEAYLDQHPEAQQRQGSNIFTVSDEAITKRISEVVKAQADNEERVQKAKQAQIKSNEQLLVGAKAQERSLEAALKQYEAIDIFNKQGDLKDEFKTQGKFDSSKLAAALDKAQEAVRASVGGDVNSRFQLETLFFQRRIALNKEAQAQERVEYLKSSEARVQTEKEGLQKNVEDIKRKRQELQSKEAEQFAGLSGGQQILADYITKIKAAGEGLRSSKKDFEPLNEALSDYQKALTKLNESRRTENGVTFFDPRALEETSRAFNASIDKIIAVRDKIGRAGELRSGDLTPGQAKTAIGQLATEGRETAKGLFITGEDEQQNKKDFKEKVEGPIAALKDQFPQLALQGAKSLEELNKSFKTLANGGVEDLRKQLEIIQNLIPKVGPAAPIKGGRVGFLDDATGNDVAYAASGGVVGQFPGQPRGVDVYPIWAAKGETIINAETSAMYAPMLHAIMQRRAPRYMAEGGVVGGGTTNIGDININVTGATTNSETARVIGNRLERQLRQNNIRLEPRT